MCNSKIGHIPNYIKLTEKDKKEIEEAKKQIRKVKVSKNSYFKGFKEKKIDKQE